MKKLNYLIIFFLLSSMGSAMANTVTKTAEQIGTLYGWSAKSIYGSFALNSVISVKVLPGGDNGYYSADSPIDWRVYQARNNGRFDITAQPGWVITAVQFTYGCSGSAVSKLVDEKGTAYFSGQTVQVDRLDTLRMHVENAGTQARISKFSITFAYRDSLVLAETFSQVDQTKNASSEITWNGDMAHWKAKNVRRAVNDTLDHNIRGTWSKMNGYIQSTDLEGGIKAIRFNWRQWGGINNGATLKVAVQAGDFKDTVSAQGLPVTETIPTMTFDKEVKCKENQQMSIKNITYTSNDANDRIVFGEIFIMPYIHFIPEMQNQTIDLAYTTTYDLSTALIDNTAGEGEVVYTIVSDETGAVVLKGSQLDLSQVNSDGNVTVKAYWNNNMVSTQLKIFIKSVPYVGAALVETLSSCADQTYAATTYVVGDNAIYDWNITNFQRSSDITVGDVQATLLNYGGSITSNGEQEGGIQCVRFDYRAKETNLPLSFSIMVNNKLYSCSQPALGADTTFQFTQVASIKKNAALSVSLSKANSQTKARVIIGKISISPYLMFTVPNRVDTVAPRTESYDLQPKLLDNTQGEGQITYSILEDETAQASLTGSVVDLSGVTVNGKIKVQATWGDVTTTMSVYMYDPAAGLSSITRTVLPRKQLIDGHIRILREENIYTIVGTPLN